MSELAPEVWDKIEREYRSGVAMAAIAKAFKVSRARIKQKADELGWTRRRRGDGNTAAQTGSLNSAQQTARPAALSAAERRKRLIEQQRAAWDEISAIREDAYRLLRGEETRIVRDLATEDGTERVSRAMKLFTIVDKEADSLMRAQEGQRRAYGFDYKQQEARTKEDEEAMEERRKMAMSLIESMTRFKRQQANCRCHQEGCIEALDPESQAAPEAS